MSTEFGQPATEAAGECAEDGHHDQNEDADGQCHRDADQPEPRWVRDRRDCPKQFVQRPERREPTDECGTKSSRGAVAASSLDQIAGEYAPDDDRSERDSLGGAPRFERGKWERE
nr:hypothetical protein [Haloplanus sp. HW8-1]